jgi:hypothetical protein
MLTLLLSLALSAAAQTTPVGPVPLAAPAGGAPQLQIAVEGALTEYFPDLHADIGPSIDSLKTAILNEPDTDKKAALNAVYETLRDPRKAASLSLPAHVEKRLEQVAAHVQRKPELASRVAAPIESGPAQPSAQPAPAASPTLDSARGSDVQGRGPTILVPKHSGLVNWNGESFDETIFQTDGKDPLANWLKAHAKADELHQANYNYDLAEMAQSTVDQSKRGRPQLLVGDYSNWFPHKLSPTAHGAQASERTEAMKLILDNLGPNLKLWITKGIGSIGINHNKYSRFIVSGMDPLGQGGSANYTQTSFTPKTLTHFENVYFYSDKARTDLDEAYFQWLIRHAKPFSEDLTVQDVEPHFDPSDPIPTDPHPSLAFGGKLFPLNSFSPNGGTEDWLVLGYQLADAGADILMFAPFPTQKEKAVILAMLQHGLPVRMNGDAGQLHNALPGLKDLLAAGLELRSTHGPDPNSRDIHQKMHNKVIVFRRKDGTSLLKRGSLNDSNNALSHNFENSPFITDGGVIALYDDYYNLVWSKGEAPTAQDMQKAEEAHRQNGGPTGPWHGEPKKK